MATLPTNPVGAATDLTVDGPTQTYPALLPVESHRPTAYPFGVISIPATSVFFATRLSYASVNQSPIMPGHVLIMPRSNVPRVHMMRSDEVADIWLTAQHVARVLEERLKAAAMTFAIQDGATTEHECRAARGHRHHCMLTEWTSHHSLSFLLLCA